MKRVLTGYVDGVEKDPVALDEEKDEVALEELRNLHQFNVSLDNFVMHFLWRICVFFKGGTFEKSAA